MLRDSLENAIFFDLKKCRVYIYTHTQMYTHQQVTGGMCVYIQMHTCNMWAKVGLHFIWKKMCRL